MWCQHCQQDVPADRSAESGVARCVRCRREFASILSAATRPADCGLELDGGYEASETAGGPWRSTAHDADGDVDKLAAIAAKLKPRRRNDPAFGRTAPFRWAENAEARAVAVSSVPQGPSAPPIARPRPAWGVALLLWGGAAVFLAGALSMAWAAAFKLTGPWQWGLSTTLFGEGLLIVGLSLAAVRLWRNSRRINRQLEGVGAQIDELGDLAGRIAHARMSCSQAYYEHFGATTSPSLALSNLRGQLDQLAARLER